MQLVSALVFIFLSQKACGEPGEPVELTDANFKDLVLNSGRNAFVKFHAPWCGHCRNIRPVWDKLADMHLDSKASKTVMIGDVDCTTDEGKPLCDRIGMSGYPTFKYFTRETGEEGVDYNLDRTLEGFDEFVTKELVQVTWCNAKTKEHCADWQLAYISEQQGKTKEEWQAELDYLLETKEFGTPYKVHPEGHSECTVIDPGPACNPFQTPELEPKKGYSCCNSLGSFCIGFLYVSSATQKARDGTDLASMYFCKSLADGGKGFFAQPGQPKEQQAVAYVKPEPSEELVDAKPESRTWLMQRVEMLESLLDIQRKHTPEPPSADMLAALEAQAKMREEAQQEGEQEVSDVRLLNEASETPKDEL